MSRRLFHALAACVRVACCCGCLKCLCRRREARENEAAQQEGRLKRFRKFMFGGKMRFAFLRRALFRRQAEQRMNKLIEEELVKMGKIPRPSEPAPRPSALGILKRGLKKQRTRLSRVSVADVAGVIRDPKAAADGADRGDDSDSSDDGGSSVVPEGAASPLGRAITQRFRSHYQPRQAPGAFVKVHLKRTLKINGSCFVSSRSTEFDPSQWAWRFLEPGVAAARFEFAVEDAHAHPLEVRLCENYSPLSLEGRSTSKVDVTLNGNLLCEGRSPASSEPATWIARLDPTVLLAGDNVLEIALCSDAAPWNYLLTSVAIKKPAISRVPPTTEDVVAFVEEIHNAPAAAPELTALEQVQAMRVLLAKRDLEKERVKHEVQVAEAKESQFKSVARKVAKARRLGAAFGGETKKEKDAAQLVAEAEAKRKKVDDAAAEAHAALMTEYETESAKVLRKKAKAEKREKNADWYKYLEQLKKYGADDLGADP